VGVVGFGMLDGKQNVYRFEYGTEADHQHLGGHLAMWDAVQRRRTFAGPAGYRRFRAKNIAELRAKGTRWCVADAAIADSCGCYFCGLDAPACELAEFGERLLVEAFESGEFGPPVFLTTAWTNRS